MGAVEVGGVSVPLVVVGGILAVALIVAVIVVILAAGRKKKPAPVREAPRAAVVAPVAAAASRAPAAVPVAAAPPAPSAPVAPAPASNVSRFVLDLSTRDSIVPLGRNPAEPALVDGALSLGPFQGVKSVASLPARPGQMFRVTYTARAASDPTNGRVNRFRAGPLFADAGGKILKWWPMQPPLLVADGARTSIVEVDAPEGSVTAFVGAHGPWEKDGDPSDGVIAFSALEIEAVGG